MRRRHRHLALVHLAQPAESAQCVRQLRAKRREGLHAQLRLDRLVPAGRTRSRDDLLSASTQAPKLLAGQRYTVRRALESGDTVALDVEWNATLKVPLSQTPAGGTLTARISMWARFRDGRICEQTNFDCYQPF